MLRTITILCVNIVIAFGETPIVETTHGLVSGKVLQSLYERKDYYGFMGIPFAAPPVRDLRFKAPQEIDPWNGTLLAMKEKPACIQFNNDIKKGQPLGLYGSEDCLYLDIFTPAIDQKKRAVIVFIYNERMQNSYNKTRDYAPDFFIEEDVIIVTPSHRLGTFGFLSFEDEVLPGNAGLQDIEMSLQWISENIEHFGGDPERITLMGYHGGAAAVDMLIHSKAKGLFHSAILQSGTSLQSIYLQENIRERAIKLGELFDIPSKHCVKLLKELQDIEPHRIFRNELQSTPDDYNADHQRGLIPFGPIVQSNPEGILTEYPENVSEKINIPIMFGFNSREGISHAHHYLSQPNFFGAINKHFPLLMPMRLKFRFDPTHDDYMNAIDEVKEYYFGKDVIKIKDLPNFINYIEDVSTTYALNEMVKSYANRTSVYYYLFDFYSRLNQNKNNILKLSEVKDGTWGATSGDELCYLFKCPELTETYMNAKNMSSQEADIQIKMVKMWSNFAKYGNPTPDNDNPLHVQWPQYDTESKKYLHIQDVITVRTDLRKNRFNFWDETLAKWEKRILGEKYIKDEL